LNRCILVYFEEKRASQSRVTYVIQNQFITPEKPSADAGAAQALPTRQQFRVSKLLLRYYWSVSAYSHHFINASNKLLRPSNHALGRRSVKHKNKTAEELKTTAVIHLK